MGIFTNAKKKIIEQKFRFDIGFTLVGLANFAMLIRLNQDGFIKLVPWAFRQKLYATGYEDLITLFFFVPIGFAFVWIAGWILDKYVRYENEMMTTKNLRNPQLMEILETVRALKQNMLDSKDKGDENENSISGGRFGDY